VLFHRLVKQAILVKFRFAYLYDNGNSRTMKAAQKTNAADLENRVRELLDNAGFLKVRPVRAAGRTTSPDRRADAVFQVTSGDRKWTLVVEAKRPGQPRQIRDATAQLEAYLQRLPRSTRRYGIVAAPFISAQSARICQEAGLGYADLAGNARIAFDNVFIETRSAENPFREKRESRSLFALRATRVLRSLLQAWGG